MYYWSIHQEIEATALACWYAGRRGQKLQRRILQQRQAAGFLLAVSASVGHRAAGPQRRGAPPLFFFRFATHNSHHLLPSTGSTPCTDSVTETTTQAERRAGARVG